MLILLENLRFLLENETLKTKNKVTSTFLTKLLKNESLLWVYSFSVIEKYGSVRCTNIFADYGFCVFHLWKSIFNEPKFGTTQWNTPGSKDMPLWRSVFHIWRIKRADVYLGVRKRRGHIWMKQVHVVKYLKNRHSFRRNSVTPGGYK
jgi:hypothetical protein